MVHDFRDAVFEAVHKIMKIDDQVMILYNDFGAQGLDKIKDEFPQRVINVGIAEQNMISVAAGLALAGKKIFIYSIAAHVTTRCYEQVKLDICGMSLPVFILGMGSGLSYGVDGPTHQATADIGIMRALPGMAIYNPADAITAQAIVQLAWENNIPAYIRLDKDQHDALYNSKSEDFSEGLHHFDAKGSITLVTTGMLVHRAIAVKKRLEQAGVMINIVDLYRIKPCNEEVLKKIFSKSSHVVTLEEHSSIGGISTLVAEILASMESKIQFSKITLWDEICFGSESRTWAHNRCGLSENSLMQTLKDINSNGVA
ncbi:MAG: transketolase family protein [Methanoregula sp.]